MYSFLYIKSHIIFLYFYQIQRTLPFHSRVGWRVFGYFKRSRINISFNWNYLGAKGFTHLHSFEHTNQDFGYSFWLYWIFLPRDATNDELWERLRWARVQYADKFQYFPNLLLKNWHQSLLCFRLRWQLNDWRLIGKNVYFASYACL